MAGDWIKMRTDLAIDPHVIAIADRLMGSPEFHQRCCDSRGQSCDSRVTQSVAIHVVVSSLLKVWDLARSKGKVEVVKWEDIVLKPAGLSTIDAITHVPGFGKALEYAEWAKAERGNAVRFPNCVKHIYSPDEIKRMRDAERQREFRHGNEAALSQVCHKKVAPTGHNNTEHISKEPVSGFSKIEWWSKFTEQDLKDDSKIEALFGAAVAAGYAKDDDFEFRQFAALVFNVRRAKKTKSRFGLFARIIEGRVRDKYSDSSDWRKRAIERDHDDSRQALKQLEGVGSSRASVPHVAESDAAREQAESLERQRTALANFNPKDGKAAS